MESLSHSAGVGPETVIGISLHRSIELIIGVLGIIKAGAAYVPIDPTYPAERVQLLLQESNVPLVVTSSAISLPTAAQRINLDELSIASSDDASNPLCLVSPSNLVSIIFTSGSTGKPKGVMATHAGLANRLLWMWKEYPYQAADVCCQKTSISFVDSLAEIFSPLCQGVKLVTLPQSDAFTLLDALERYHITRLVLVPSLLQQMLAEGKKEMSNLAVLVVSGEEIKKTAAQEFTLRFPRCTFLNLYGSSEVAADCTYFEIGLDSDRYSSIPIGKAIDNFSLYILDENMQPVPRGEAGELFVGGVGVARGYLDQPGLTEERFIANPFIEPKAGLGGSLFRIGDVVRLLADGNLEYLGRRDQQIKIRGVRIECDEIENSIRLVERRVSEVVIAKKVDSSSEEELLIAYIVLSSDFCGAEYEIAELIKQLNMGLRAVLPIAMVPNQFIVIDAMPLNPNGKIDRAALLSVPQRVYRDLNFEEPSTKMEQWLCELWSRILRLDCAAISRNDNFYYLGGHSLLLTRLRSEIQKALSVDIPLGAMFESVVLKEQAANLERYSSSLLMYVMLDHLTCL